VTRAVADLYKTEATTAATSRHRSRTQQSTGEQTTLPASVKKTTSVSMSYDTRGVPHAIHRQKCAPRKYDSDSGELFDALSTRVYRKVTSV